MKVTNYVYLGAYNIVSRKKHSFFLLLNILVISSIVISWSVLASTLSTAHDDLLYGAASQCVIETGLQVNQAGGMPEGIKYAPIDLLEYLGKEDSWSFVNIKHVQMEIENNIYEGNNDYSYDFENYKLSDGRQSVPFKIVLVLSDSYFSPKEIEEYYYQNDNTYKEALICGTNTINDKELLISDYYLEKFGIEPDDYKDVLGKKVSFYCDGNKVLEEFTIAGIVDSRIFYDDFLLGSPQIIFRDDNDALTKYNCEMIYNKIPVENFEELVDTYTNLIDSGNDASAMGLDAAVKYSIIEKSQVVLKKILLIFGALIIGAVILNLSHVLQMDLKHKYEYYGIVLANGMRNHMLMIISYIEIAILTLIANMFSVAISAGILFFVEKLLYSYLGMELSINFSNYLEIYIYW